MFQKNDISGVYIVRNIIGVHIWDGEVKLACCDDDSVQTAVVELPRDLRRTVSLTNEYTFKQALKIIDEYIKNELGITEYDLAFCIPDSFGLKEIYDIKRYAEESDIRVVKTIPETLAIAYYSYVEYNFEGNALIAFVAPGYLSLSEYKFSEGVIEKVDTYVAGRWKGSSLSNTSYLHKNSNKLMDATEAETIIFSGTMNRCLEFDQAMKNYVSTSGTFINTNLGYEMIDAQCVIEGLGLACGVLEMRPAFRGLISKESLSPYDLFISFNGDIYPVVDSETRVPFNMEITAGKISETKLAYNSIKILEKKDLQFETVKELKISIDDLSDFIRKSLKIYVNSDDFRNIEIIINDLQSGNEKCISVSDYVEPENLEAIEEEDVGTFVTKIIPIIDSLEYASKFAENEDSPYTRGIIQSYHKAIEILESNGVSIISGEGEPFDYNYQSAVAHVTDIELPDNTVKQVMQTGYTYKGKVLRPASVIVAN